MAITIIIRLFLLLLDYLLLFDCYIDFEIIIRLLFIIIILLYRLFRGFLYFHTNCEIICFSSVKNTIGSLIGIALIL